MEFQLPKTRGEFKVTELTNRHEGCNALLRDDGKDQYVPVCMGGVALVGCNNSVECNKLFGERIDDPQHVYAVFHDDDGLVKSINRVAREPLVPVLPPTPRS